MNPIQKDNNAAKTEKKLILQAVERSAQIEGMSLQRAQENSKVIVELQKHGRAFAL